MKKLLITALALLVIPAMNTRAADAKENYDKSCAKCHGPEGKGDTKMGQKLEVKDLTDAKRQAALTDDAIAKAIKEGIKEGDKVRMKAIEGLTDGDIKELVGYVRKLKK
jgi:cytochrome c553